MSIDLNIYPAERFYDEMLARSNRSRSYAKHLVRHLRRMDEDELQARQDAADLAIKEYGHHLHGVHRERRCDRPGLAVRHHAADHPASRSGTRSRPG